MCELVPGSPSFMYILRPGEGRAWNEAMYLEYESRSEYTFFRLLCGAQGTYITASYSEMLPICVALAILLCIYTCILRLIAKSMPCLLN